jgi:hypothetical protein
MALPEARFDRSSPLTPSDLPPADDLYDWNSALRHSDRDVFNAAMAPDAGAYKRQYAEQDANPDWDEVSPWPDMVIAR